MYIFIIFLIVLSILIGVANGKALERDEELRKERFENYQRKKEEYERNNKNNNDNNNNYKDEYKLACEYFGFSIDTNFEKKKKKYQDLILSYHPDRNSDVEMAKRKTMEINSKWEIIKNRGR